MKKLLGLLFLLPFVANAQTLKLSTKPDSVCVKTGYVSIDSLAKMHLKSINYDTLNLLRYQRRAYGKLRTLVAQKCVTTTLDTVVVIPPVDTTTPIPPPPSPPPPDTTKPPIPPPIDTTVKVAELPRAIPVVPAGLSTKPCTVRISSGLQQALLQAVDGAVICLAPGSTHVGGFTVPARSNPNWVVVRTDTTVPAGRVTPSIAAQYRLAKIQTSNIVIPVTISSKATGWHFAGIEITTDATVINGPVALVQIGSSRETTVNDIPTDISFDGVYVHGWATAHVRRAWSANGRAMSFKNSWCEEIHASGYDSQCIITWAGTGPILIENNYLSAASENIMFGGGDPSAVGINVSDITIRHNHITKPTSWLGQPWNVKNLIETKSSQRVLIEENIIENQWWEAAPGHAAIVIKSSNQDGFCTWCQSSDWTIRRNLFRKIGTWLSIAGRADQATFKTDSTNRRITIIENWVDSVSVAPFTNQNRPNIIFTSENYDVMLVRNTVVNAGTSLEASIVFNTTSLPPVTRLLVVDNVFPRGQYGMYTTGTSEGLKSWTLGTSSGVSSWQTNVIVGATTATYPPGTTITNAANAVSLSKILKSTILGGLVGVEVPR